MNKKRFISLLLCLPFAAFFQSCTTSTEATKKIQQGGGKVLFVNVATDELQRRKIGTTIFSNNQETTATPGLSKRVKAEQFAFLKRKFGSRVESANLPSYVPKQKNLAQELTTISLLKKPIIGPEALALAKKRNADVLIFVQPSPITAYGRPKHLATAGFSEVLETTTFAKKIYGRGAFNIAVVDVATGKHIYSESASEIYKPGVEIPGHSWNRQFKTYSAIEKQAVKEAIFKDSVNKFKTYIDGVRM